MNTFNGCGITDATTHIPQGFSRFSARAPAGGHGALTH